MSDKPKRKGPFYDGHPSYYHFKKLDYQKFRAGYNAFVIDRKPLSTCSKMAGISTQTFKKWIEYYWTHGNFPKGLWKDEKD